MTTVETGKVMAVLRGAYPMFYKDMSQDEAKQIVLLWAEMFADDPYELVILAVKALIATDVKGFPPHIGSVKEKIRAISEPKKMTEAEAWDSVSKALRRSLYNSEEEFEKLPDDVKPIVGSSSQLKEWSMMDTETVQSVVASNFQRSYRARSKQEEDYRALPDSVKKIVWTFAETKRLDATHPQPGLPGEADQRAKDDMDRLRQMMKEGKL